MHVYTYMHACACAEVVAVVCEVLKRKPCTRVDGKKSGVSDDNYAHPCVHVMACRISHHHYTIQRNVFFDTRRELEIECPTGAGPNLT